MLRRPLPGLREATYRLTRPPRIPSDAKARLPPVSVSPLALPPGTQTVYVRFDAFQRL